MNDVSGFKKADEYIAFSLQGCVHRRDAERLKESEAPAESVMFFCRLC